MKGALSKIVRMTIGLPLGSVSARRRAPSIPALRVRTQAGRALGRDTRFGVRLAKRSQRKKLQAFNDGRRAEWLAQVVWPVAHITRFGTSRGAMGPGSSRAARARPGHEVGSPFWRLDRPGSAVNHSRKARLYCTASGTREPSAGWLSGLFAGGPRQVSQSRLRYRPQRDGETVANQRLDRDCPGCTVQGFVIRFGTSCGIVGPGSRAQARTRPGHVVGIRFWRNKANRTNCNSFNDGRRGSMVDASCGRQGRRGARWVPALRAQAARSAGTRGWEFVLAERSQPKELQLVQ